MATPNPIDARRGRLIAAALAGLALLLYMPGFWWGVPHATAADRSHAWGVDDETPLGALGQVHNIVSSQAHRNAGYPRMHSFMVTAVYSPYLAFTWLNGGIEGIETDYPFGLADPAVSIRNLALLGHLLSVCLGAAIVLIAFWTGATLWDRATGTWSALLVLFMYPMFYYTRTGNVDVPALFFVALAAASLASCLSRGFTIRRAIWLGVWAGFAVATKESALGALIAVPVVLLYSAIPRPLGAERARFWRAAAASLAAAALAFGLGSGLFLDTRWFASHLQETRERLELVASGEVPTDDAYRYNLEDSAALLVKQVRCLIDATSLPGLILAVFGAAWVARYEPQKLAMFWLALGYLVFMYTLVRSGQLRYVMPAAFLLALYAGRALGLASGAALGLARTPVLVLGVAAIGLGCAHGASLTYEMVNDSRYAAAAWLATRTTAGDQIEYFGASQKLPPLKAGVVTRRAAPFRGMYVAADVSEETIRQIQRGWDERRPKFVLVIPDHTSPPGQLHSHTMPPTLFEELVSGTAAYLQVASFHTEPPFRWPRRPPLDYPAVNPPIQVFARAEQG